MTEIINKESIQGKKITTLYFIHALQSLFSISMSIEMLFNLDQITRNIMLF